MTSSFGNFYFKIPNMLKIIDSKFVNIYYSAVSKRHGVYTFRRRIDPRRCVELVKVRLLHYFLNLTMKFNYQFNENNKIVW